MRHYDYIRQALNTIMIDKEIMKIIEKTGTDDPNGLNRLKRKLIKDKQKYRGFLKETMKPQHYSNYVNSQIVNSGGDYDGVWTKVFFPGERWDKEAMREFIDSNWTCCPNSPYDCTGAIFTWAIDCFNVPSGVVVYIREAMDV